MSKVPLTSSGEECLAKSLLARRFITLQVLVGWQYHGVLAHQGMIDSFQVEVKEKPRQSMKGLACGLVVLLAV